MGKFHEALNLTGDSSNSTGSCVTSDRCSPCFEGKFALEVAELGLNSLD